MRIVLALALLLAACTTAEPETSTENTSIQAPNFSFPNQAGELVSLQQFKGQLIYISFWATWCGYCKKELPYLEKLKAQMNDQPVVFIHISVDEHKDRWEQFLNERSLLGEHLFANGFDHLDTMYSSYGVPHYALIDARGYFIDPNAPSPSENVHKIIEEHLGNL